jgi:uncharacterized membrane protein
MSKQTFLIFKIITAISLSIIVSISVNMNYWYVALVAIITAFIFLSICRKKVNEVLADERDYVLAGKAAMMTFIISSMLMVSLGIVIFSIGRGIEKYEYVANTLFYSSCFLVFLYSASFHIYRLKK